MGFQIGVASVHNAYLANVAESVDVWHRGGFVSAHNYFPRLLVEFHTKLVQAQGSGFRGSACVQWEETAQGEYYITSQERQRCRRGERLSVQCSEHTLRGVLRLPLLIRHTKPCSRITGVIKGLVEAANEGGSLYTYSNRVGTKTSKTLPSGIAKC